MAWSSCCRSLENVAFSMQQIQNTKSPKDGTGIGIGAGIIGNGASESTSLAMRVETIKQPNAHQAYKRFRSRLETAHFATSFSHPHQRLYIHILNNHQIGRCCKRP